MTNGGLTRARYTLPMNEAVADPNLGDSAESTLRQDLARGDGMIGAIAPVLRHVLGEQDKALFAEIIVAHLRGMLSDIARQLLGAAQGDPAAPVSDGLPDLLAASLAECSPLLCHLHAVAIEWRLGELLADRAALDPVCPPLVQALIASEEPGTAAAAMGLLAAQARFHQQQRRMRQPLAELPGDVLHATLLVLRAHLAVLAHEGESDLALADSIAAQAEAHIRRDYDESTTRLALHLRMITQLGGGALAALELAHAGFALFASALAIATGQPRETCVLASQQEQLARLALSLRAAGLRPAQVEANLLALHPDATLPGGFERIAPDRAADILARGVSQAPFSALWPAGG